MAALSRPLKPVLASLGASLLVLWARGMPPHAVQPRLENDTNQIIDSSRPWAARLKALAQSHALQHNEQLPATPRNPAVDTLSLAPVRAGLEAALAESRRRAKVPDAELLAALGSQPRSPDGDALQGPLLRDPVRTLLGLAVQARGDADHFRVATLLSSGDFGLERDPDLAKGFHEVGLVLLKLRAELGDADAAFRLGLYQFGLYPLPDTRAANGTDAGLEWIKYASHRGHVEAIQLLIQLTAEGMPGLPPNPAASKRWKEMEVEILDGSHLAAPPRLLPAKLTAMESLRPQLTAALAAARTTLKAAKLKDADFGDRKEAALMQEDPKTGLLELAALAAGGHSASAFAVATTLSSGAGWLEPDMNLAMQFRHCAFELRQAEAERGDAEAALRIARLKLHSRTAAPDLAGALSWLSYAAELGNTKAVEELVKLYTEGGLGQAPDPLKAAHWTAFGETIGSADFKPRKALR